MAEEPPTDAPIESAELTPDNAASNNKAEVNVAKDWPSSERAICLLLVKVFLGK